MSTGNVIRSEGKFDSSFVRDVIKFGGSDLKICMQCSVCTVACPLSPDVNPFPRKEMIWSQWGLKDQLLKDADIWMCHECGDCSKECPRNAKPGSVMTALRNVVITHYSWPSFLGKAFREKWFIPIFTLIPIALFFLVYYTFNLSIPNSGPIYYSSFIPFNLVDYAGIAVGLFAIFSLGYGSWRYYGTLKEDRKGEIPFLKAALITLKIFLLHSNFNRCESNHSRYYSHILVFYGFIALLLATFVGAIEIHLFGFSHLLIGEPQNIIGNIGLIIIFPGIVIAISNRISKKIPKVETYFDWYFIILLSLIVITGFSLEILRLMNDIIAYYVYASHLILVFMLIAYAPYSKFAHVFYRFIALTYLTSIGRTPSETLA
ncbi:MAG: quinone-interacting membrane-bound oxidoreductase complex subunit QmoC [Thermoplasmatales archaeon]